MSKLPIISGIKVVKALAEIGYKIDHQTGSHMILRCENAPHRRVTVPNHDEIDRGTLLSIIKQSGLIKEEFLDLLK